MCVNLSIKIISKLLKTDYINNFFFLDKTCTLDNAKTSFNWKKGINFFSLIFNTILEIIEEVRLIFDLFIAKPRIRDYLIFKNKMFLVVIWVKN